MLDQRNSLHKGVRPLQRKTKALLLDSQLLFEIFALDVAVVTLILMSIFNEHKITVFQIGYPVVHAQCNGAVCNYEKNSLNMPMSLIKDSNYLKLQGLEFDIGNT